MLRNNAIVHVFNLGGNKVVFKVNAGGILKPEFRESGKHFPFVKECRWQYHIKG